MNRILLLLLMAAPVCAMLNPAAMYCQEMGYEYYTNQTEYGEMGICVVGGEPVEEWDFLTGKEASNYSYCAREGYGVEIVEGGPCEKFLLDSCMACALPDGRRVEVTELMGLDFRETVCGDSMCGFPETYASCPQDCPSGGRDEYCDAAQGGRCDPDCRGGEDSDCAPQAGIEMALAALAALIAIAIIAILLAAKIFGKK